MSTIKWGIIGCGNVCEVKSGPGLQKAANSELVAVMRRDPGLAEDYARRHNVSKWYSEAQTLIVDPEVNAIYIATPPGNHLEFTRLAAQAGKPVYVEKPMARNYAECLEMIKICHEAGVPLFVAYYRRAMPRFVKIKELLESGSIGEVRLATLEFYRPPLDSSQELPWRVQPEIAGGGLFVDVGSHALDLMDYWFGPVQKVQGFAANRGGLYQAEDLVTATFVHENGVQVMGAWCFTSFESRDRLEFIGSKGKLSSSLFSEEPIVLTTAEGPQEIPFAYPKHVQQPLIQMIVDELNGQGRSPSTGQSAARTNRVMDEILKTYQPL